MKRRCVARSPHEKRSGMAIVDDTQLRNTIREQIIHTQLSEEDRETVVGELLENVLSAVNLAILERMSEDERATLLEKCDAGNDDAVLAYIKESVGELDPIITEALNTVISGFKTKLYGDRR
ncbi:MAG: hypothetical protein UY69_C0002G0024 [Parcubacteria group bacterium GW2011_GWF1_52_5]|nr:MAG: hypothetical protein UY69_C0002G0024 [Parcubacteria group bacterium GW2011_GWF1_52_5]